MVSTISVFGGSSVRDFSFVRRRIKGRDPLGAPASPRFGAALIFDGVRKCLVEMRAVAKEAGRREREQRPEFPQVIFERSPR